MALAVEVVSRRQGVIIVKKALKTGVLCIVLTDQLPEPVNTMLKEQVRSIDQPPPSEWVAES